VVALTHPSHGFCFHPLPQGRLEIAAANQIHLLLQQILQLQLQGGVIQQAGALGQVHQQIHIAAGTGLVARHRPEYSQVAAPYWASRTSI